MENSSYLQQNYVQLSIKMEDLKHLRNQVEKRGRAEMGDWLKKVDGREVAVDKIGKDLNELKTGSGSNSLLAKNNLNQEVLANLRAVNDLKKEANARFEYVGQNLTELAKRYMRGEIKNFISKFPNFISTDDGDVYVGHFRDGKQVAVRVFPQEQVADEIFITEVSTIARACHRHLVKLYGFCFDGDMRALVYECMENGSLAEILYENHHSSLEWENLYIIAIETAKGLVYMHEGCGEQIIIHHDVWAGNVLLDEKFSAKVTGFGLSKLLKRDATHCTKTRFRGSPGYAAPEMWELASQITNKCDVYSFGMMLFEILRKKRNTDGRKWFPGVVWEKFKNGELEQFIRYCGIKEKDSEKAYILSTVALWCAQKTPKIRPSMKDIVMVLENQMQVNSPPDPFELQPLEYTMLRRVSLTMAESLHKTSSPKKAGECASSSPLAQPLKTTTVDLNRVKYTVDSGTSNLPRNSIAIEILNQFEKKCPPQGENSVIMYTTTIEQMKRPFKESNEVRSILRSHNIQIIERDVWGADFNYDDELKDLVGGIDTPVVFVEGRLIGGAKEVKTLEVEGKLKILFDGIPKY
ncbi:Pr5-like receptor kinase [Thalictrum thalictroides]|uniref:Pr5-like receptor kinase n=1 Tax=Thalictrum thalictroides TaxID=46969 RepID=A0A7J6WAK7_THATH|nr:Pr5-like receptor kinase [Thalictrum thalictroides]